MPPNTLGNYILGKTLGRGASCKVKMAKQKDTGERCALKILEQDQDFQSLIDAEIDTLQKLDHPNIIRLIEVNEAEQFNASKNKKRVVKYIALELVKGGELFDLISLDMGTKLDERIARSIFKQILDGLAYMHQAGITHRDMKPENILLDDKFNIKIADFGFAAPTAGRDGSGTLQTVLGTMSYMAPELHLQRKYKGEVVDLFAAGIILFQILTHRPPFNNASPQDYHYKLIVTGKADEFWDLHEQASGQPGFFSAEYKDLFQKMMTLNPKERLTLQQVLDHPFMQAEHASATEVIEELTRRKDMAYANAHQEADRANQQAQLQEERTRRSRVLGEESFVDGSVFKDHEVRLYSQDIFTVWKENRFLTAGNQDHYMNLFAKLIEYLSKIDVKPQVSDKVLKLTFEMTDRQTTKIKNLYLSEFEAIPKDKRTKNQNAVLEQEERKQIDIMNQKAAEEVKGEDVHVAFVTIELQGICADEESSTPLFFCVDFRYHDKNKKQLKFNCQQRSHFCAMRTLLTKWENWSIQDQQMAYKEMQAQRAQEQVKV